MEFIVNNEGILGLFKGIAPQITKGLIVQGLLMMTKERYVLVKPATGQSEVLIVHSMELLFIVLFRYLRKIRAEQLQKAAEIGMSKVKIVVPMTVK